MAFVNRKVHRALRRARFYHFDYSVEGQNGLVQWLCLDNPQRGFVARLTFDVEGVLWK